MPALFRSWTLAPTRRGAVRVHAWARAWLAPSSFSGCYGVRRTSLPEDHATSPRGGVVIDRPWESWSLMDGPREEVSNGRSYWAIWCLYDELWIGMAGGTSLQHALLFDHVSKARNFKRMRLMTDARARWWVFRKACFEGSTAFVEPVEEARRRRETFRDTRRYLPRERPPLAPFVRDESLDRSSTTGTMERR